MTRGEGEQLREQMETVRLRLAHDVRQLSQSARQTLDWRTHWRRHPWAISGAVAAGAYFLVPRRVRHVVLPARAIKHFARQNRLIVAQATPEQQGASGMVALLVSALASGALRQLLAYAAKQGEQVFSRWRPDEQSNLSVGRSLPEEAR